MDEMAVEVTSFEIDPATETEMLEAHGELVRTVRGTDAGLIDARLFRGQEPGSWIDVWFWASLEAATEAVESISTSPEAGKFFSFIAAPPSMIHGTLVAEDLGG